MTRAWMVLVGALVTAGCGGDSDKSTSAATAGGEATAASSPEASTPAAPEHAALFGALPAAMESESNPITEEKVTLGRMLFYETRLSKNHDLSCNSCHKLDQYGVDGEPTSPGHKGQRGGRNSPTVYNAALHIAQFWDGREPTVEAQAKGPVLNPIEMGMPSADYVVDTLKSMPEYVGLFQDAFPGDNPVTYDNFAAAVGAFERKLVTPSPFDAYVAGDADALNESQRAGLDLFVQTGCTACHNGVGVGGGMYQKLGLVSPWPGLEDLGRGELEGKEAEQGFFKVPSLRNITKTGPYFHDGKTAELTDAVRMMGKHQLGRELSAEQVTSIVTFLDALTGEIDPAYVARPELPPSSATTPKPDPT